MQLGRFSSDDLRLLLSLLPMFDGEVAETMVLVKEKREKVFTGRFSKVYWCNFYELPFLEHLAKYIVMLGLSNDVKAIVTAPNQVEAVAAWLEGADEKIDAEFDTATREELDQFTENIPFMLALATSVYNSLRCLLAFGCYLNDLIAQARGGENERALFNAIRIDPTVVGCPTALAYISRAVLTDDKTFMSKLKAALNGKLEKREQANFQKMRLVLQVLFEAGAAKLTDEQLHELFVKELNLYSPDKKAGDVTKNLRKFANQYMKDRTTT